MKRFVLLASLALFAVACERDDPTVPVDAASFAKTPKCEEPPCNDKDKGSGKEQTFAFLFPANESDALVGEYWSQDRVHSALGGPTDADCWGPVFEDHDPGVPGEERYMLCPIEEGQPGFVLRVVGSSGTGVPGGTLSFTYCADQVGNPTPVSTCCCTPPGKARHYHRETLLGEPLPEEAWGDGYFKVILPGTWPRWDLDESIGVGLFYDADDRGGPEHIRKWYSFLSGFNGS